MTATASEPKTRAPKAIAVSKLIGGKLVTTLGKSEIDRIERAWNLCRDLQTIDEWSLEAEEAGNALTSLLKKVRG